MGTIQKNDAKLVEAAKWPVETQGLGALRHWLDQSTPGCDHAETPGGLGKDQSDPKPAMRTCTVAISPVTVLRTSTSLNDEGTWK